MSSAAAEFAKEKPSTWPAWGTECYAYVHKEVREAGKFSPHAVQGIFIGFDRHVVNGVKVAKLAHMFEMLDDPIESISTHTNAKFYTGRFPFIRWRRVSQAAKSSPWSAPFTVPSPFRSASQVAETQAVPVRSTHSSSQAFSQQNGSTTQTASQHEASWQDGVSLA